MSLEAWGDQFPEDDYDHLLDAGWLTDDDAREWMEAILMAAPSHQGGHSETGQRFADIIGTEFPLTMDGLIKRAVEMKFDPVELWPWAKQSLSLAGYGTEQKQNETVGVGGGSNL